MRLELKSISCKGVKSGIPFQKPSLYAVVSVAGGGERPDQRENHHQRQRVKTPVDRRGGENPEWDHPVQLDIGGRRDQGGVLEFEIKAEAILGNKVVGKVRIPLADFDFTGALRHVSYQVRSPDGKPNGTLNCSYRIDDPEAIAAPPAPTPSPAVDHYAPPPPPSAPAAGLYPSAPGADYYTPPPPPSAPASGLYPSPPSPTAPAIDYYSSSAPPSAPAAGFYPPPTAPAPAVNYYPAPEPVVAYPSQAPGFGYYPRPDPAFCCPAPAPAFYPRPDPGCGYAPPSGGYYPPPPPVHSAYPPPPPPGCCEAYPPPPPPGCCDPAPRDRGLYGYF